MDLRKSLVEEANWKKTFDHLTQEVGGLWLDFPLVTPAKYLNPAE
jgi:hypothetical protein